MNVTRAVYPGTFDPITNGHIDLVEHVRPARQLAPQLDRPACPITMITAAAIQAHLPPHIVTGAPRRLVGYTSFSFPRLFFPRQRYSGCRFPS